MQEDFMVPQHQAADNTQEIHNINTRVIPSNIQKCHIELIKKWRTEDELFMMKLEDLQQYWTWSSLKII